MTFSHSRFVPFNVRLVEADFTLVQTGGKSIYELREDFFDNAVNLSDSKGKPIRIVSPYDIAMSGGEPYATWK
jgi:hypothetical protein